jgi:hypothetical protein
MPDQENVERQQFCGADRNDVEQPAIQIEILVIEQRRIAKSARIIIDDQFAVTMLDLSLGGQRSGAPARPVSVWIP